MRHVIVRKAPANTLSPSLPPSISFSLSNRLGWTWVGIGLFVLAIAGMLHKGFPEMYKNKLKEKLVNWGFIQKLRLQSMFQRTFPNSIPNKEQPISY